MLAFSIDQEYGSVRPELSGVLSGLALAKSDNDVVQIPIREWHIVHNQTAVFNQRGQ